MGNYLPKANFRLLPVYPTYPPIYLCIIYLPINVSTQNQSIRSTTHPFTHYLFLYVLVYTYPFIHLSIYLFLSIYLSTCLPTHIPTCPFILSFKGLCVCVCVYVCVCGGGCITYPPTKAWWVVFSRRTSQRLPPHMLSLDGRCDPPAIEGPRPFPLPWAGVCCDWGRNSALCLGGYRQHSFCRVLSGTLVLGPNPPALRKP